jgi:hypothetical protein
VLVFDASNNQTKWTDIIGWGVIVHFGFYWGVKMKIRRLPI